MTDEITHDPPRYCGDPCCGKLLTRDLEERKDHFERRNFCRGQECKKHSPKRGRKSPPKMKQFMIAPKNVGDMWSRKAAGD